jgi:cytochrome c
LGAEKVYGVVAYVLFLNEIIGEQDRMNASSVPQVRMPNRDGSSPDARPDVEGGTAAHR